MPHQGPLSRRSAHRLGRALTAALALCLAGVLAGCGQTVVAAGTARSSTITAHHATPTSTRGVAATATPTSTPTLTIVQGTGSPTPGASPAWRHANLPGGFGMSFDQTDLRVAPSDGETAYSCALPAGASHVQVVVTHDGGTTWSRMTDLPFSVPTGGCQSILVDALKPSIVVVCCGGLNGYSAQAISTDGGASWRLSGGAQTPQVIQLATRGSRTYAVLGFQQSSGLLIQLGASDDGLRTWNVLDASLHSTNDRALWVNPADGSLLLETWPDGGYQEMWQTTDDGAHWSRIPLPLPNVVEYVVQQPLAAGQLWHICGLFSNGGNGPDALACTSDSGRTWTQEPPLDESGSFYPVAFTGLPADGSLLVTSLRGSSDGLYRLPAGASQWQTLGDVSTGSDGGCAYARTNATGALWTFPTESDGAGAPEPTDAVYSAVYPY